MRPKKRILLYCENPNVSSVVKFILDTRHFLPFLAQTLTEATQLMNVCAEFDAAMIVRTTAFDQSRPTLSEARKRGLRTLFLDDCSKALGLDDVTADVFLPHGACTEEWLVRLKILSARKRGPKNLSKYVRIATSVGEGMCA